MNNEPVAWMVDGVLFTSLGAALNISFDIEQPCIPLYTHPAKELTDEEVYRLLADSIWAVGLNTDCLDEQNWADGITVARARLRKAQSK